MSTTPPWIFDDLLSSLFRNTRDAPRQLAVALFRADEQRQLVVLVARTPA
jgi:hypothetical protein